MGVLRVPQALHPAWGGGVREAWLGYHPVLHQGIGLPESRQCVAATKSLIAHPGRARQNGPEQSIPGIEVLQQPYWSFSFDPADAVYGIKNEFLTPWIVFNWTDWNLRIILDERI